MLSLVVLVLFKRTGTWLMTIITNVLSSFLNRLSYVNKERV